jgi:hypothetical protein
MPHSKYSSSVQRKIRFAERGSTDIQLAPEDSKRNNVPQHSKAARCGKYLHCIVVRCSYRPGKIYPTLSVTSFTEAPLCTKISPHTSAKSSQKSLRLLINGFYSFDTPISPLLQEKSDVHSQRQAVEQRLLCGPLNPSGA